MQLASVPKLLTCSDGATQHQKILFPAEVELHVASIQEGEIISATVLSSTAYQRVESLAACRCRCTIQLQGVSGKHPDVVERLLALAEEAREELGDSLTGRTGTGVRSPAQ